MTFFAVFRLLAMLMYTGAVLASPEPEVAKVGDEIFIPSGQFNMGSTAGARDEVPVIRREIRAFYLDRSPVSVSQFAAFVKKEDYKTTAEVVGDSAVFDMQFGLWSLVPGADFRHPLGVDGPLALLDHPVTHVSWFDADIYCRAQGKRLPTEAEFEFAAKSGIDGDPVYAFGGKVVKDGAFLVNVYTGFFPFKNTGEDGYVYTAPVGKTGITPLGLTDMAGNVWEWSDDWYLPYKNTRDRTPTEKAQRGGSFLCDEDYCHGYRTTARAHSTPDTSAIHVGFRCARDSQNPVLVSGARH